VLCAVAQAGSHQLVSMEAWLVTAFCVVRVHGDRFSERFFFNVVSHSSTLAPYSVVSYVGVVIRGCAYLET